MTKEVIWSIMKRKEKNKKIIILILSLLITSIPIISTQSPTPTPSSTGISTPPSTKPLCGGIAKIKFTKTEEIEFGPSDTPENLIEKAKKLIKELLDDISSYEHGRDFFECKYPPDFRCDKTKCNVLYSFESYRATILPVGDNSDFEITDSQKEGSGKLTIYLSYINLVKIGKPPQMPGSSAPSKESLKHNENFQKWLNKVIDSIAPQLLKELDRLINELNEKYPCLEGEGRTISIAPNLFGVEIEPWGARIPYTNVGILGIKVIVPYNWIIICTKIDNPSKVKLFLDFEMSKECKNKNE